MTIENGFRLIMIQLVGVTVVVIGFHYWGEKKGYEFALGEVKENSGPSPRSEEGPTSSLLLQDDEAEERTCTFVR